MSPMLRSCFWGHLPRQLWLHITFSILLLICKAEGKGNKSIRQKLLITENHTISKSFLCDMCCKHEAVHEAVVCYPDVRVHIWDTPDVILKMMKFLRQRVLACRWFVLIDVAMFLYNCLILCILIQLK